tara:strand:+ start:130 stop:312 length:183 start_codon:yes stop_codon:yes gene_type:complete
MQDKSFYLNILQLIDYSCKNGAWAGKDLTFVSTVRQETVKRLQESEIVESKKDKDKKNVE